MPPASWANDRWVSASTRSSGSSWVPSSAVSRAADACVTDGLALWPRSAGLVLRAERLAVLTAVVDTAGRARHVRQLRRLPARARREGRGGGLPPVSYTHLTLPTIYSV